MASTHRVAYSPGEFAELFGKSQTWGYRQIYAGKVKAITEHGRILIPATEVERLLESAGIYQGRVKSTEKGKLKKLSSTELSLWQKFVKERQLEGGAPLQCQAVKKPVSDVPRPKWNSKSSPGMREKLARSWENR